MFVAGTQSRVFPFIEKNYANCSWTKVSPFTSAKPYMLTASFNQRDACGLFRMQTLFADGGGGLSVSLHSRQINEKNGALKLRK
jgi:hypothetical protein